MSKMIKAYTVISVTTALYDDYNKNNPDEDPYTIGVVRHTFIDSAVSSGIISQRTTASTIYGICMSAIYTRLGVAPNDVHARRSIPLADISKVAADIGDELFEKESENS